MLLPLNLAAVARRQNVSSQQIDSRFLTVIYGRDLHVVGQHTILQCEAGNRQDFIPVVCQLMMIMVIIVVWGLGPVGLGWVWVDEMDPRTTLRHVSWAVLAAALSRWRYRFTEPSDGRITVCR